MRKKKNIVSLILMAVCASLLIFGSSPVLAENSLKVGVYGGYFKDSFDKHIFPDFTKDTGIKVESVAEPTGEAWLVQLEQAARAGMAPADVSMMAQGPMLRGQRNELWMPLDLKQIPNSKFLLNQHVHKYQDGRVDGIGAVSWYITLVSNTKVFPDAPTSWADMWQADKKNKLGLLALASNSFLLEITAKTFFGGYDVLNTKEGVLKVLNKLAEIKPNVKLW
jgi:putative spermidine/putrescine transport system substrate-binding protein